MSKIIETKMNRFDGGIVNDPRDPNENTSRMVANFDILTNPYKMTPYRSSEDGNSNAANDLMQAWCLALRTGSTYSLYGLGRQTATNKVRIFFKNLTTGASTDLDDNGWTETANNLGTQTTPSYNCFVYYKNQGLIFGLHANRYIWSYDPSGVAAFGDTLYDLTSFTNCAQGLVHSQDDILYIPVDNKIYSKNGAGAFGLALTLPSQYYITSICEYGANIAIGAAPLDGISNSRVYVWDRSTTLATIKENVDWGYGVLKVLEEVGGYLIGISLYGGQSATFNDRIAFKYYTGAGSKRFKEIIGSSAGTTLLQTKQRINNRLFFQMKISLNGSVRDGVWSFGLNDLGKFNLLQERTSNNDTAIGNGALAGFFYVQDYLFQAFTTTGGTHTVTKTDDQANYTHTSIWESKIFNAGDASLKKDLIGVSCMTEYLPTAGQIVIKYRKNEETSYTTISTETTDNSISHSAVNIESSGLNLPTDYKEIQFRIESTGGAEPTGFSFQEMITGKRIYKAIWEAILNFGKALMS